MSILYFFTNNSLTEDKKVLTKKIIKTINLYKTNTYNNAADSEKLRE